LRDVAEGVGYEDGKLFFPKIIVVELQPVAGKCTVLPLRISFSNIMFEALSDE
jgi:hypothetical protein